MPLATHTTNRIPIHLQYILPLEQDLTTDRTGRRLGQQACERHTSDTFAAATLAKNRHGLTAILNGKIDPMHHLVGFTTGVKGNTQIGNFE
jgi:hypothetical protein